MAGRSRDGGSVRKLTVCLVYLLTLLGELSVSYVGAPALLSFSLSLLYFFLSCGLSLVITILPPLLLLLAHNVPLPVSFLRSAVGFHLFLTEVTLPDRPGSHSYEPAVTRRSH